ncbi:MAG TPA: DegT/DnrJ/EryC1/StrS family aminotransferase [Vicinamibacterales bacterium]|nr:DegT/DnrJ/EryC1/StrS family aminotransferase [Vicinamibacterales bacterium]
MRIGRTQPPAAALLEWRDIANGIAGIRDPRGAVRAFEDGMRRDLGVRHAVAVSSGRAGLLLTLQALQTLSPRRDVVIPAFTCFSVAGAVVHAGLRPVLCDIDPDTFDFDRRALPEAITSDTLCVIAHHLFGVPAAVARTRTLCHERGAFLVEDAAQALGGEIGGRPIGTFGDAGIFSFGRGKNVTCGSGGLVVTNSDAVASAVGERAARLTAPPAAAQIADLARTILMMIFIRPSLYWLPAALPFLGLGTTTFPKAIRAERLSGFRAGLLRDWRARLARSNRARTAVVSYFARALSLRGSARPYLRLPIVAPTPAIRDRVYAKARSFGVSVSYPTPISDIPEIRAAFDGEPYPAARRVAERLLTLPTHHWLSDRDRRAIADLCRDLAAA